MWLAASAMRSRDVIAVIGASCPLLAGALTVLAPGPAAGPALALLQFFLGAADASCAGRVLLGIFDPADELVARQRRDVLPRIECGGIVDQGAAQVGRQLVHHPTRHSLAAHEATVANSAGRRLGPRPY